MTHNRRKIQRILVTLFGSIIEKAKIGFEAMNNSLKAGCESAEYAYQPCVIKNDSV
jgi:hypothetical protein